MRSFYDSNGDGIGDLNGIIEKLDYLNDGDPLTGSDLGVNGIWLMPIHPSPSYHGYDVTDYYTVNPGYGTLDDFKHLLAEAHRRGIRVIIDLVLNHTSSQHPWFLASQDPASPYRDWYIWSDTDPGYVGPSGEEVWHASASGYYYGLFSKDMPDLNYNNPAVTAKMQDVVRFWLQDLGVDGFRLDAARHLIEERTVQANSASTHAWYKAFRPFYKSLNPQALTVGEIWDNSATVSDYTQGDQLDLGFDFSLAQAFITSARAQNPAEAVRVLSADLNIFKPGQFATFLSNHDQNRVMSQLAGKADKAKLAAFMLLTAPGVPFIYYGEEIGMLGAKPDEMIRTPMQWSGEAQAGFTGGSPWEAVDPDYAATNVEAESTGPDSLLSLYRSLIQLRNQHAALRVGDTYLLDSKQAQLFTLLRASKGEILMVLLNLGKDPLDEYNLSLAEGPLSGRYQVASLLGEGSFPDLTANAQGGFDSYQPLPELAPGALVTLQLQSVK